MLVGTRSVLQCFEEIIHKEVHEHRRQQHFSQLKFNTVLQNLNYPKVQDVLRRYIQVKSKGLNGDYGKTPQYWLTYIQMVSDLQLLHYSLKVNNFELKIKCWKKLLPLCFATSKIHYSRYWTFYVEQMKNWETLYPGATEEIKDFCLVNRNSVDIGKAIVLAGEQTYMKSVKTVVTNYK